MLLRRLTDIHALHACSLAKLGRSIGSGPACYMANLLARLKHPVGGLILQCPFSSIKSVVAHLVGRAGAWAINDRFNNLERIKAVKCPLLILHGKADRLIPYEQSQALLEACPSDDKSLHLSEYADHNVFELEADVLQPISSFISKHGSQRMARAGEKEEAPSCIVPTPESHPQL